MTILIVLFLLCGIFYLTLSFIEKLNKQVNKQEREIKLLKSSNSYRDISIKSLETQILLQEIQMNLMKMNTDKLKGIGSKDDSKTI